jgi:hypothetical protein
MYSITISHAAGSTKYTNGEKTPAVFATESIWAS